jgi:hypothetical protein
MYERSTVEKLLTQTKNLFLKNDIYLLQVGSSERSLTHKFAGYMQAELGETLNVDYEYNRAGSKYKLGDKDKFIYPDIIIHKRDKNGPNIVFIGAKKASSRSKSLEKDRVKIHLAKNIYGYEHGVLIIFSKSNITWEFVD